MNSMLLKHIIIKVQTNDVLISPGGTYSTHYTLHPLDPLVYDLMTLFYYGKSNCRCHTEFYAFWNKEKHSLNKQMIYSGNYFKALNKYFFFFFFDF